MRIEYMFIGKTADERTPQKKDITNAFKECFDDVKSNSFTIKPKTKVYTIDYEVNSWKAEDATEKFPVYDVIIKSEVEEKAKNADLLDIINTKISTCAEFRKKYNVVITYNEMSGYYAEKIYPYFFTFESKLRCLVYKILIKMFGCKWVDETMHAEIISGMQQKLAAEEGSCNSAKLIEKALDEMTYHDLEEFLFSEKRKTEPEEFLHTLESETDFQGMTKEEIIELITSNEHKSNSKVTWGKTYDKMEPYNEQTDNPKFLQFEDITEELRQEYEECTNCIKLPDGRILPENNWFFRHKFVIHEDGKVYQRHYGQLKNDKRSKKAKKMTAILNYPYKKLYKTFEEFAEVGNGFKYNEHFGGYGYTFNPKAFYDWCVIGGRWPRRFLVKESCKEYSIGERSWGDIDRMIDAPEGYFWVAAARKKDVEWQAMREWEIECAKNAFYKFEEAYKTWHEGYFAETIE